jgi:hypothetical protein
MVKPDLSVPSILCVCVLCVCCTWQIPCLSEINTRLKEILKTFSERISYPSAVPTWTSESWEEKTCRCITMDLIKWTSMHADMFANPTRKCINKTVTKYFPNYSQESRRSHSKSCEHMCCSPCGSVQQRYKKIMAVTQLLNRVIPTFVIITTTIIIINNIIIKYWKPSL